MSTSLYTSSWNFGRIKPRNSDLVRGKRLSMLNRSARVQSHSKYEEKEAAKPWRGVVRSVIPHHSAETSKEKCIPEPVNDKEEVRNRNDLPKRATLSYGSRHLAQTLDKISGGASLLLRARGSMIYRADELVMRTSRSRPFQQPNSQGPALSPNDSYQNIFPPRSLRPCLCFSL